MQDYHIMLAYKMKRDCTYTLLGAMVLDLHLDLHDM